MLATLDADAARAWELRRLLPRVSAAIGVSHDGASWSAFYLTRGGHTTTATARVVVSPDGTLLRGELTRPSKVVPWMLFAPFSVLALVIGTINGAFLRGLAIAAFAFLPAAVVSAGASSGDEKAADLVRTFERVARAAENDESAPHAHPDTDD